MPNLDPGRPGTKEAFGISVVAPDGVVRIPPKAFAHYEFRAGELAVAATTHRGEPGFALLNKSRAETTVFRNIIDQLPQPDDVQRFNGKAYSLVRLGPDCLHLSPCLLDAFLLHPGDRLMSVKSTTVALSFSPAKIWAEKFRRRNRLLAAANVLKQDVF